MQCLGTACNGADVPTPSVELRDKVLLNIDETVAYLGLNEHAVRGLLENEDPAARLPAFRHGARWCIVRPELDGWAAAQITRHHKETPKT